MLEFLRNLFRKKSPGNRMASGMGNVASELQNWKAKTEFSRAQVKEAISLALKPEVRQLEFADAVQMMTRWLIPPQLSMRVINMLPILAGRIMMREMNMMPQLPGHYILNRNDGTQVAITFADCRVCILIHEVFSENPGTTMALGMGSCEMLALNDALNQIGEGATNDDLSRIQMLPTEMGGEPLTVT